VLRDSAARGVAGRPFYRTEHFHRADPMTYQPTGQPSGNFPPRRRSTPILDRLARQDALQAEIRGIAKELARTVPDLSETERTWLHDLSREETRSRHLNIDRLVDLSARSVDGAVRGRFCELVHAYTYRNAPVLGVIEASNRETEIQGKADVAVRTFEQQPTPETKRAAEEAVRLNCEAERDLLDSIHGARVA
jgi:hypothetical protein